MDSHDPEVLGRGSRDFQRCSGRAFLLQNNDPVENVFVLKAYTGGIPPPHVHDVTKKNKICHIRIRLKLVEEAEERSLSAVSIPRC